MIQKQNKNKQLWDTFEIYYDISYCHRMVETCTEEQKKKKERNKYWKTILAVYVNWLNIEYNQWTIYT